MKILTRWVLILLLAATGKLNAQTTYIPLNSDDILLIDRLEVLSGKFSESLNSSFKAESRSAMADFIFNIRETNKNKLSTIDKFNIAQMLSENAEWPIGKDGGIDSKHSLFNVFYKKQYDFYHVMTKDFFFMDNPIVNYTITHENGNPKNLMILNSRGVEARGRIASKIGFYTYLTDNQEYAPSFFGNYSALRKYVPGMDYILLADAKHKTNFDYFLAGGYVDFSIVQDRVYCTFGTGKNFIGDGIRSLFLSDNSANTTYLKIQSKIRKFNYENLFLELTSPFIYFSRLLDHRYATIQYLNTNIAKNINVGIFEGTVFHKPNEYDLTYLNPVMFYNSVAHYVGNDNKVLAGVNLKAMLGGGMQLYSQFLVDEAVSQKNLGTARRTSNNFGLQIGGKYFNAFNIANLDLQGEINAVKPFTYSNNDSTTNYTNYNQPLADPLGSGFVEVIGTLRYQPAKNWVITSRGTYYKRGADTGKTNYGNNLFLDNSTGITNGASAWIAGVQTNCAMLSLNFSYQIFRNVFIDFGGAHRRFVTEVTKVPISTNLGITTGNSSSTWAYFGVRWNAPKRQYDSYF